jgi:translocation protein SEC63
LPSWLVEKENAFFVLLAYTLVFGIALPLWVANWWRGSKNFTKDRIMHETMGRFYRDLKESIKMRGEIRINTNDVALIDLLATAEEFKLLDTLTSAPADPEAIKTLAESVKSALFEQSREKFDKSRPYGIYPWHYKTTVLLFAHFLRVKISDPILRDQQAMVVGKSAHLVQGMLQIAISRNWMGVSIMVIDLGQDIIQGLYFTQIALRQVPYLDGREVQKALNGKKKKITTVRQLLEIDPEELK